MQRKNSSSGVYTTAQLLIHWLQNNQAVIDLVNIPNQTVCKFLRSSQADAIG